MSTTALVRSSSSSNTLTAPAQQPKAASPISTISLPKLSAASPSQDRTPSQHTPPSKTPTPQPSPAQAPTPGRWQHPRMNEITRRQNSNNFDKSNAWKVINNTAFLLVSVTLLPAYLPRSWILALHPYSTYGFLFLQFFALVNIGIALLPLFRKPDPCEDIPLTPAQRQLLGLQPMSRPSTPQEKEHWVTPPRYSRSNTPRSASSSLRAEASNSPLSGRGTPVPTSSAYRYSPSSPFGGSPTGTPLGAEKRRLSYNMSSNRSLPLSVSEFDAAGSVNTPTKNMKNTSLEKALNNKWLYEKGKAYPGRESWGSGSVFS